MQSDAILHVTLRSSRSDTELFPTVPEVSFCGDSVNFDNLGMEIHKKLFARETKHYRETLARCGQDQASGKKMSVD